MQDKVLNCNDADEKKQQKKTNKENPRLALFFITIPAEFHFDWLFVSNERLFMVTNIVEEVKNK